MLNIIQALKDAQSEKDTAKIINMLLPELFQAEEDGLIIEVPCKVGAEVYRLVTLCNGQHVIVKGIVFEYSIDKRAEEFYFAGLSEKTKMYDIWCAMSLFGETVFLTRAEAEKRLKESN